MFKRKRSKLLIIALIVIAIFSALNGVLSTKMAGYDYLSFTSTSMEIIPKEMEWENRTKIHKNRQINDVLSIVKDASYYSENPFKCDKQNWDLRLIVRRNVAKDDLSWLICGGMDASYLIPLLGEYRGAVFKEDKK